MSYEHWFPGKCADVLAMAKNWIQLVSANKTLWNIPDTTLQDLTAKTAAAQSAFDLVQSADDWYPCCGCQYHKEDFVCL